MQSAIGSSSRIRNGPLRNVGKTEELSVILASFFYNIPEIFKIQAGDLFLRIISRHFIFLLSAGIIP